MIMDSKHGTTKHSAIKHDTIIASDNKNLSSIYGNDEIVDIILKRLTEKRLKHTIGVRDTALKLCDIYGEDRNKAEIASVCHDMFRGRNSHEINLLIDEFAEKYGPDYKLDEKRYKDNPNLSHGKLAAIYMEKELGITDSDVLNAVSFHTTGRPDMSMLEKIIFIADAIEPGRDYPGVDELRRIAYSDIDAACLQSLRGTVQHLRDIGTPINIIDMDTLDAIEYFSERV